MNSQVKDHMTQLPQTIGADISLHKAKAFMAECSCHHLPVLDGGKLVGVISDRDIRLVEAIPHGLDTLVQDLMSEEPVVVAPETSIKNIVEIMLAKKINSVIVRAAARQPWGIFTSTDALQHLRDIL